MLMLDVYICLCVGMRERARARASVFLDHGVAVELRIKVSRYTPRRQHNTHKVSQCKIHNLHEGVRRRCAEAAACQRVGPNTNLIIDNPYGCSRNIKFQQSKKPELGKIPNKPEATKSKKTGGQKLGKASRPHDQTKTDKCRPQGDCRPRCESSSPPGPQNQTTHVRMGYR